MLKREVRIKLLDTHCHLDLYPSYDSILADCFDAHVRIVAVTTTPLAFEGNVQRSGGNSLISVALGLHPQIAGTAHANLSAFLELLPRAQFVGEVGLDASPAHYGSYPQQRRLFGQIVAACAESGGRSISVHSVRSVRDVLAVVAENDPDRRNRYALHWFTGNASDLRKAVEIGCFFSVNQAMTRSDRGSRIVAQMPQASVMTETDGPFIKVGTAPIRPAMVRTVVADLAVNWNVDVGRAASTIMENFERFADTT